VFGLPGGCVGQTTISAPKALRGILFFLGSPFSLATGLNAAGSLLIAAIIAATAPVFRRGAFYQSARVLRLAALSAFR